MTVATKPRRVHARTTRVLWGSGGCPPPRRGHVIANGRVTASIAASDLLRDDKVRAAYLGPSPVAGSTRSRLAMSRASRRVRSARLPYNLYGSFQDMRWTADSESKYQSPENEHAQSWACDMNVKNLRNVSIGERS